MQDVFAGRYERQNPGKKEKCTSPLFPPLASDTTRLVKLVVVASQNRQNRFVVFFALLYLVWSEKHDLPACGDHDHAHS
jgi:hypothetical protein